MILTGENRSTRRQTCPSVTLCTTNLTWTDMRSNPCPSGDRPATNLRTDIRLNCVQKCSPYHAVNRARVHEKNNRKDSCLLKMVIRRTAVIVYWECIPSVVQQAVHILTDTV